MKTKNYLSLFLCALLLLGTLTGCGASSGSTRNSKSMAYDSAAAVEEAAEYAVAETMAAGALKNGTTESGSTALPEGRKWIITVNMTAETEDLDALTVQLDEHITALGGYVEDQSIYNGSTYSSRRYRSASLTVRIPADDVEEFAQEVSGIANVVSQQTNREDVTLSYVATESRVTALQTEEARLLELLAEAETMADLLEIEARLTDVRYELESYTSQLRLYDNQIDYATIYLNIEEVQEYTPVEEPTLWERISGGFKDSLKGLGEGTLDLLVWLITTSPYLAVLALTALVILLLIRRVRKINAKKKAQKEDKK